MCIYINIDIVLINYIDIAFDHIGPTMLFHLISPASESFHHHAMASPLVWGEPRWPPRPRHAPCPSGPRSSPRCAWERAAGPVRRGC